MSNFKKNKNNSIDLIDIEKLLKELEALMDTNIFNIYGEEEFEKVESEIEKLKWEIEDLEKSIAEIEDYLELLIKNMRISFNNNFITVIEEEIKNLNQRLEKFEKDLQIKKKLVNEYGEKNIRVFYYFCKTYFKGDRNTHIFLYPKGYWFEDETIESILSKEDDFNHYNNIIKMEERVLEKVINSDAPIFMKKIVYKLIEQKIEEFKKQYPLLI